MANRRREYYNEQVSLAWFVRAAGLCVIENYAAVYCCKHELMIDILGMIVYMLAYVDSVHISDTYVHLLYNGISK